jgi:hypothetical protein
MEPCAPQCAAANGIVMPTLRRAQTLRPDGTAIAKPVLIDDESFDAVFE